MSNSSAVAVRTVERNLEATGLAGRATVLRRDAFGLLEQGPASAFDYVYLAPPQYRGLWVEALRQLDRRPAWTSDDAWVVAQIDPREQTEVPLNRLSQFDERTYGQTRLLFFRQEA